MSKRVPWNKGLTKDDHESLQRISDKMRGEKHYNWKGGRKKSGDYYFLLKPDHPRADSNGYVLEQIIVAEEILGRPLKKGEIVHHINMDKGDNRKENLRICTRSEWSYLIPIVKN